MSALVGAGTLADVWRRHVLDCGQIMDHLPPGAAPVVDIGSGAGLPGLVLAILGAPDVHLIESDSRKCVFLREAARQTATDVQVIEGRAETVEPIRAGVITARAVAPVDRLLELSERHIIPNTICFFLKGKTLKSELKDIKMKWSMNSETLPSRSSPEGAILRLESVARAHVDRS